MNTRHGKSKQPQGSYQDKYLRHFVAFAFPRKSLVIERIVLCTDVDGLPALVRLVSLGNVEDVQAICDVGHQPFFRFRNRVAIRADFLVERNR